jgi:acetyl esterase/lipase
MNYPVPGDKDAWRKYAAAGDAMVLPLLEQMRPGGEFETVERTVGTVPIYDTTPVGPAVARRPIMLEVHGGGLIGLAGPLCRAMSANLALRFGARLWSVDYRMPPDFPYPAGLDDCVAVYRALLEERPPEEIVVTGASAGGNLAAALILRARDEGLPLPAGAVLMTPEVDLTESGDTFSTLEGIDSLQRLMPVNLLYADGHDLRHPYLSPLFGDFSKGFPPSLLTSGTRDLFLSNTVRLHRALRAVGIHAELHILEAGLHPGLPGTPEDAEITREISRFLDEIGRRAGL